MKELIIDIIPWFLSANTLYFTFLAGSKNKNTWIIALFGQLFWSIWIVMSENWGLLPMNIGMWVLYYRNNIKWNLKK